MDKYRHAISTCQGVVSALPSCAGASEMKPLLQVAISPAETPDSTSKEEEAGLLKD